MRYDAGLLKHLFKGRASNKLALLTTERNLPDMSPASKNSLGSRDTLTVGGRSYEVYRLDALERRGIGHAGQLPFSLRVLLENLLRQEDGRFVRTADIEALAEWQPKAATRSEIAFMPARVLLQDFTGVPAVADLAAMRDAMGRMGGDAKKINPLLPAELVIDHSVQVDQFGIERRVRIQRRAGIPTQRRAVPIPALGTESVSEFPRGAAGYRHRAPGESGIPGARGL